MRHSLDGLISTHRNRPRDAESERFGSLEIDDELEPRRLLDRKVRREGATQDSVDECCRAANLLRQVGPVCQQAASVHILSARKTGRKLKPQRKLGDPIALTEEHRISQEDDRFGLGPRDRSERGVEFFRPVCREDLKLHLM